MMYAPTKSRTHYQTVTQVRITPAMCRSHAGDDRCILDGEENDACELLRMLADFIKAELQTSFREHSAAGLSSHSALQDVLSASMGDMPQASECLVGTKPVVKFHEAAMSNEPSEDFDTPNQLSMPADQPGRWVNASAAFCQD